MESIAIYYLSILPAIRKAARRHGYAVGMHGSLSRDFDLIAVPWQDIVSPPDVLVVAICDAVCGQVSARGDGGTWPREKPHGRMAWSIQIGGGAYLDLSVIPPTSGEV